MISQRVRHFLAIAEARSFTAAAVRLGIGQPPLSQSIQRLEESLGVRLLERTARGVSLTASGEAFLSEARVAVDAADRARAAAQAATRADRPVRVGVILPAIFLPLKRLLELARDCGVDTIAIDGSTAEVLEMLSKGELDISFVTPPFGEIPALELIPVGRERVVAALPDELAALPSRYAPMREMASRLIVPPRTYGEALHDATISMFTVAGYHPKVAAETTRVMTMLSMTAANVGASIVAPSIARSIQMDGVTFRPFAPEVITPFWEIALAFFPPQPGSSLNRLVEGARATMLDLSTA